MGISRIELLAARDGALTAARQAGALMRRNLHAPKRATEVTAHDIKLELDVRTQRLIQRKLAKAFPRAAFLGEEGMKHIAGAEYRWVVDPIDGTVNFAYGIPHACVSIALQEHLGPASRKGQSVYEDGYETVLGVVYDPFCEELWSAVRGGRTRLNGKVVRVSGRAEPAEAMVTMGSPTREKGMAKGMQEFGRLVRQVRKVRMMGSAALSLTYVATGRFDAYIERGVRLWDIAAGGFLVERAGGEFWRKRIPGEWRFAVIASNGKLGKRLGSPAPGK